MNTPTSPSDKTTPKRRSLGGGQGNPPGQRIGGACPICGGLGFVVPDLPPGHPEFGKAVPCTCREQERLDRRLRNLNEKSSIRTVDHLTFTAFLPEGKGLPPDKAQNLRLAYETCLEFSNHPQGWLLLTGTYGCGKTHLAAAIANERLARGQLALFMVIPDLLDHLRAAFSPESEITYDALFEQLRTTPLLVLDDFGAQSSSTWAQEKLFQLLNYRYNGRLPTVITSNLRLEDIEPRIRSRLLDLDLVTRLPIQAPDFRTGPTHSSGELSTLGLHRDQLFGTFDARRREISAGERENLQIIFAECRSYAANPEGWLVLSGTSGCGKTHLAAAIANEYFDRTQSEVMFVSVPELLDYLRGAYSPQSTVPYDRRFDEIKRVPMLVLDNLGTESATAWAREKLTQLLDYRFNARSLTVITTKYKLKDLDKNDPWLYTRMADDTRCKFLIFYVPGYRSRTNRDESAPPAIRSAPARK